MHPFTSLALWFWLSASVIYLPLDLPLLLISGGVFISVLIWTASRWRWRFIAWLMIPMAIGLWLVHSGWLAHWITNASLDTSNQHAAIALWLRLLAIISAAQLWLQYTTTEQFIKALFASRLPVSFSYLLAGPLLLVEQLNQQLQNIKEAQLARGVPLDGNFYQRLSALPAVLFPLISHTLSDLAIRGAALDMRGFRIIAKRTMLSPPTDSSLQVVLRYAILLIILIEGGIWLWW
ncbi:transmembrane component of queuosine-regulated ECF transporter energizing module [Proteus hauseri ATCC 700826]|uniref:Transmembrane component of queuosine-regulated ECF transporter energizing module n=1 Tax=Proteus hauseri ATCC 700826 TaxID=1354271 RepID=A0AAJ3HS86_PROHU|nr:energy-coupling factor transporter transmembrane component T [Proteus hauseri]OAT46634.1 transmembrane component of queuosine-regulated ECF transporter energizing module [Proteus hauseri ATCC 700826]